MFYSSFEAVFFLPQLRPARAKIPVVFCYSPWHILLQYGNKGAISHSVVDSPLVLLVGHSKTCNRNGYKSGEMSQSS